MRLHVPICLFMYLFIFYLCTRSQSRSYPMATSKTRESKIQDQKEAPQRCFLIAWPRRRLSLVTRDSINVSPSLDPFADWLRLDTLFAHDNGCFCRFRPRGVPSWGRSLGAFSEVYFRFFLPFLSFPLFLPVLLDLVVLMSEVGLLFLIFIF